MTRTYLRYVYIGCVFCSPILYWLYISTLGGGSAELSNYWGPSKDSYSHITDRLVHLSSQFVISNKSCSNDITALIWVHSLIQSYSRRQFVRNTWGKSILKTESVNRSERITFKILFAVGRHGDAKVESSLRNESIKFGDIVQLGFLDAKENTTSKVLGGFQWHTRNCKNASMLFQIFDSDLVIPIRLKRKILAMPRESEAIFIPQPGRAIRRPGQSTGYLNFAGVKSYERDARLPLLTTSNIAKILANIPKYADYFPTLDNREEITGEGTDDVVKAVYGVQLYKVPKHFLENLHHVADVLSLDYNCSKAYTGTNCGGERGV